MMYKELSHNGEKCVSRITGIQFCILGPDEVRKRSVAEITKTDRMDIDEPVMNGLFDSRMGVIDNNKVCKTCEQRNTFCPGHFGHIEMVRPVFYIQFFSIVQKLLRCVCFRCSKILVDLNDPVVVAILSKKTTRQKRWEHMHKLCSNVKRCGKETIDGCGARQPDRVAKTDMMKILMEWKDLDTSDENSEPTVRRQVYGADEVLRILKRITDEDAEALGFSPKYNRPEWMMCTVLPVAPPCVRPSVRNDTGVRKDDDLTHKLGDIIKYNNIVRNLIEKNASYDTIESMILILQQHVATLIDNTGAVSTKDRTGRVFRTICDRLNKKEGRIRGNLMGKRVDFSARTVITPDPNISIDELGVPIKIAMNLTFPEVVNEYNIDNMYRLVRNGPDVYPGAKHVRKGNRTIRLRGNDRESLVLEFGDMVERHLINGDYVLFNRQPSLHKMSMMAHKVRVMPHNTFRLNVCVCASYNADFDGDEMNMHVPQSLQTHEEIVALAAVPLHIISPRHSKPIISIVQDVALGVFRITQGDVSVSKKQMCNLTCSNPMFNCELPSERYSGRFILSTIIPSTTMLSMYPDVKPDDTGYSPNDHHVRVKCGVLQSGVLNTKAFNDPARGLIRNIMNDGGPEMVTDFLNNMQKVVCDWLVIAGFSVGISDLMAPAFKKVKIKQQVAEMHKTVAEKIASLHAGTMKNVSTLNNRAFFESQIDAVTKKCQLDVEKVSLGDIDVFDNRMMNMIKSGSKGQPVNFLQMLACLGQQSIDSQRIPDGFNYRTLPHFTKYDDSAASRGFVEHSFMDGLTPQEFFFHSMGGRIGLIDTAVRSVTWETPVVVFEDGTCRYVRIGEWIDAHLASNTSDIRVYPEDRNLEMLDVSFNKTYMPTLDDDGNVTWGLVTSVTRHDPGDRLYRVKTQSGREVIVAESKSLLVFDSNLMKFMEKNSPDVRVGDALPVTMSMPAAPATVTRVIVSDYLPGGDVYFEYYDFFELTKENGTFFGLYLADGNTTTDTVDVTHDSTRVQEFVKGWFEKQGVVAETTLELNVTTGRSASLARFFDKFMGTTEKYVPDIAFAAPEEFIVGFLNGYFSGTGTFVNSSDGWISVSCMSKRLQDGIAMLCARVGAFAETTYTDIPSTCSDMANTIAEITIILAEAHDILADVHNIPADTTTTTIASSVLADTSNTLADTSNTLANTSNTLANTSRLLAETSYIVAGASRLRTTDNGLYRINVRAQWAAKLASKLDLIPPAKHAHLTVLRDTRVHSKYEEHNDVILDRVTSIDVLGVDAYPKLYDVTVPSTLNFVIANGLGVRDTSETGYLQRQLVTFMQDLKVHVDLTVRNSAGQVVQFLYGEDGIDATKVEYQILPYVEVDIGAMRADYLLTSIDELSGHVTDDVLNVPFDQAKYVKYFEQVVADREFAIEVKKGLMEAEIMHPVNMSIMVLKASELMQAHGVVGLSDLHPDVVMDKIEELTRELCCSKYGTTKYMGMLIRCHLSPKIIIMKRRFTAKVFDAVVRQIKMRFFESIAHPGEMVGILAAQSIGEPTTQTTLNSVHYDTEFLLKIDGVLTRTTIGDYVEGKIAAHAEVPAARLEKHPKDTTFLWLKDGGDEGPVASGVQILSCDEDGKVFWDEVTAVTKHPVINEDGSDTLLRVTTHTGRAVTATKGLSFVKRINNKITKVKGSDLQIGDYLPISSTLKFSDEDIIFDHLDVSMYLRKDEFTYGSEMIKAVAFSKTKRTWFMEHNGKDFTVPYSRSDSVTESCKATNYEAGYVYPKKCTRTIAKVPDKLPLTRAFGFMVGAYLAEGCVSQCNDGVKDKDQFHQLLISNVDKNYQDKIDVYCTTLNLKYHWDDKYVNNGHSVTMRMHSVVFATLFKRMCGYLAQNKRFPAHLLNANDAFIKGVIDGYISGDGCVPKGSSYVTASSVSRGLMEDMRLIFLRYGLRSCIHARMPKDPKHQIGYELNIKNISLFARTFSLTIASKQERLDNAYIKHMDKSYTDYDRDIIPDIVLADGTTVVRQRSDIAVRNTSVDAVTFTRAREQDLFFDKIVKIEEVPNTKSHVYDWTTRVSRRFASYDNLLLFDTFHLAGVGAASITTQQGVPRLQELFRVSKNIKTPYMKIFVREPWNTDMSRCRDVCSVVQTTRFRDVVRYSKVYYDPPTADESTTIKEDVPLLQAFKRYTAATDPQCTSPWVLRFEFDRTKMLELQVTMLDLEIILREFYDDTIACVFGDDNAHDLVARVRLNGKDIDEGDMLTELRALEDNIMQTVVIKGVKNIEKAVPLKPNDQLVYDKMTSTFVKRGEWAIETSGTNLIEVLSLPHVDPERTYSNDINEIHNVLGIEAARQALYNELQSVMWQKDSNSVNYRHMALLVDAMTSRGFLTSVNRHGINKCDIGPLAKCSFERTTEMLIQAGVFSELDKITGVAANIMLGQVASCGTGDSEIIIDEAALEAQGFVVKVPDNKKTMRDEVSPESKPSVPQLPRYEVQKAAEARAEVQGDELEIF